MKTIVEVSPYRCRVWDLHDRLSDGITEDSCRAEMESFESYGQLVPVFGRPLQKDPDHDFELICGARRLFVARQIDKPLLVDVREDLSDRDAILAMDIENRQRKDLSAYEHGMSYSRWLRLGIFESQEELAEAINMSASKVSRLLKLARLPTAIVEAFGSPQEICEGWGGDMADALEDPERRKPMIQTARRISSNSLRQSPKSTFRKLMSSGQPKHDLRSDHNNVVKSSNGQPLFRIRRQQKSIAILLPVDRVSSDSLNRIVELLVGVLNRHESGQQGTEDIDLDEFEMPRKSASAPSLHSAIS